MLSCVVVLLYVVVSPGGPVQSVASFRTARKRMPHYGQLRMCEPRYVCGGTYVQIHVHVRTKISYVCCFTLYGVHVCTYV